MQSHKDNPCKSFAPNIFNKNKCQNCFRPRETHLLSDKDLSKAKPIYGGWLLLAPIGTDFKNPTQKNRKWQRRWFVLFEHGALRYALDNSETTVAQGTIDMNRCSDVVYAESITNQKHSLCISLPDQSYYIRGECKEDTMGWYDQLVIYPQTMKEEMRLKKRLFKRKPDLIANATQQSDEVKKPTVGSPLLRSRNSSSSSIKSPSSDKGFNLSQFTSIKAKAADETNTSQDKASRSYVDLTSGKENLRSNGKPSSNANVHETKPAQTSNKISTSQGTTDRKQQNDATQRDKVDGIVPPADRLQRHISISTSSLDSTTSSHSLAESTDGSQTGSSKNKHFKDYHNLTADVAKTKRISNPHHKEQQREVEKRTRARSPGRDEADRMIGRERRRSRAYSAFEVSQVDPSNKENSEPSGALSDGSHSDHTGSPAVGVASPLSSPVATPRDSSDREDRRGRSIARRSTDKKQGTQTEQPRSSAALRRAKSLDRTVYDSMHISADLINVKKGWLQVQLNGENWSKHWFVLAKRELKYYQDSSADDTCTPDGVIDLVNFIGVKEVDVQRNYGFQIQTGNETYTFAALTSGMRTKWMNAVRKATDTSDVVDGQQPKPVEPKSDNIDLVQKPGEPPELSATERSQRRKERVRERRKGGRSRTYDFGEFRPLATKARDQDADNKAAVKPEPKARSRTFEPVSLLKDLKNPMSTNKEDVVDGVKKSETIKNSTTKVPPIPRSSSNIRVSIESEWKKIENVNYSSINGDSTLPNNNNRITETASMVKALQTEVDSLKKQMERVQAERSHTEEEILLKTDFSPDSNITAIDGKDSTKLYNQQINKLKQELSIAQEALRKQNSELREYSMQLDIRQSESQLVETQLTNAQNELHLEKSRRKEAEKDHLRKVETLTKELENSESQLKKTETLNLDAQRRIRELERQMHMQKDHNKEEELLQDHIGRLRGRAEEQEQEMKEMQEAFEERCQNQKQLEDRLSEASTLLKSYEEQLHEMNESLKNTNKDISIVSAHRNEAQLAVKKLQAEVEALQSSEEKLKQQVEKLLAQSEVDEDCNKSLQGDLKREKETNKRLSSLLQERDDDFSSNEERLLEFTSNIDQLNARLKTSEDENLALQKKLKDSNADNKKLTDQVGKSQQAEQELRSRLKAAETQLHDIEEIRSRSSESTESSFKAKLTELEAEMGGTGQMIAARLQSLEPSRRVSDPHIIVEKETLTHKIHRLESELEKKTKDINENEDKLKQSENKLKELEDRENETEEEFTAKLKKLKAIQESTSKDYEKTINVLKEDCNELKEKHQVTLDCLKQLHSRICQIEHADNLNYAAKMLEAVTLDILKLSSGNNELSDAPQRSPSPKLDVGDKKWSRVTDAESRQQHQRTMSRLRQLTERLKNSDGRLLSPSASSVTFAVQPGSPSTSLKSGTKDIQPRPQDLPIPNPTRSLTDDVAAQLFAKQISTQAFLLAEMAATLRRSQSSPALANAGRIPPNFNHNNRQNTTSPQLTSAEFSDTIAHHTTTGGLLQHIDTLAQKLTLEGMLMREISRLKETWLSNRGGRNLPHRQVGSNSQPTSELSSAMVAHAHISYVLQVYNERISRLSLEARQARHRADAAMRKLRELVTACKTRDLDAVSNLAVQVDTDSIAPPYSDVPSWEQQVDYGTLHGAQSVTPPSSAEAAHLDQEATFFHHLSDDLKCMSVDVQSLSKLGAQLLQTDATLQKFLQPSEIGEHASTVAREAIVQAEVIYISHRLRRDYDEELRKAKNAVFEQSNHFEALKSKVKQSDESWSGKLKQVTEEHNTKVTKLMQEADRLKKAGADVAKEVEEKLTRLSRKHEQEMATCNAKHEQECVSLRKELSTSKSQLQVKSKEYMSEIKGLTQRLEQIQLQHRKESDETRDDYNRKFEKAKAECSREVSKLKKNHDMEVSGLKEEFEKEISEVEKEFADKLTSIEASKKLEIESLTKKHRSSVKSMKEAHQKALKEAGDKAESNLDSAKRELDNLLKQEKSKHQMALDDARDAAESTMRDLVKQKTSELKKEHDKMLENRDKLHKEQLEREKETWLREVRLQWEAEHEVSHSRSNSSTSEGDSKDVLKARITTLEEQLNSMQGRLEDEQSRHNYREQLDEIKTLCDESFASIEETHAKQLSELETSHRREMERLKEEQEEELLTNKDDTRRVIEAMRKHHLDELRALQEQPVQTGSNQNESLRNDLEKLKNELETLSGLYSRKCVDLANAVKQNEKCEDTLKSLERDHRRLQARKTTISDQKIESEMKKLKNSSSDEQFAGDLYQMQVLLRVKASEIEYLKQEVSSLNKQLDESYQEIKQVNRKHKTVFEELTLSRSKEGLKRREVSRLKGQLQRHGIQSDDDLDAEGVGEPHEKNDSPSGYDFQKSRSQPDFKPVAPVTSSVTSTSASVKRRSSDRSSRHGKV